MLTKDSLKKDFAKEWQKHYLVETFKEKGFARKSCTQCKKNFWTLDTGKKVCGDSGCQPYDFIETPLVKKKLDYIETWKTFEKFFVENGHTSVPRYPVVDRWRPDLFFTIASIQDFQRLEQGNMAFVYPSNPLIIPQVCIRFADIQNVGLTGRHLTSFIMPGQHAFGYPKEGYFKDRCMQLDFDFLTKKIGIQKEKLSYIEDVWAMPDFSAFGPSIETFAGGLELVNHVFMEFQANNDGKSFRPLDIKVNDTGWGHERLVWISNSTQTLYDCVFGNLIEKMKKQAGINVDSKLFSTYSKLAGKLDVDETQNIAAVRKAIASKIGVSVGDLTSQIEPMKAIYAIADHTRTLLFAATDGGIPSNVGGGYNLRVILRRSLSFIDEFKLDLHLIDIAEKHAAFLKPIFPELAEGLKTLGKILDIEQDRYRKTLVDGRKIIAQIISSGKPVDEKEFVKLYESHGITPELVEEVAKEKKIKVSVPENFYGLLSSKHLIEKVEEKKVDLNLSGLPQTKVLFYDNPKQQEFEGKVTRVVGKDKNFSWLVLDQTLFYPESGGQEYDTGLIDNRKVVDVQKFGNVIAHKTEGFNFKEGQKIKGKVDWERRLQHKKHHTAIHIINAAAGKVLGRHVWQAGAHKSVEKAHIDITHFQSLTEDEVKDIEKLANETVKKSIRIKSEFLDRKDAEKKYGLRIYQGGIAPDKTLRILTIPDWDIEACSGTHCEDTAEIGKIVITSTERIQDGIVRITIKAGPAAEEYVRENVSIYNTILNKINNSGIIKIVGKEKDHDEILGQLKHVGGVFSIPIGHLEKNIDRFLSEIKSFSGEAATLRKHLGQKADSSGMKNVKDMKAAADYIFDFWKRLKKEADLLKQEIAKDAVGLLLKKEKSGKIFDIVDMDRKAMISTASEILSKKPGTTIILANRQGDVIGMSKKTDIGSDIRTLCQQAGGSGGGSGELAQGKGDPEKLKKLIL